MYVNKEIINKVDDILLTINKKSRRDFMMTIRSIRPYSKDNCELVQKFISEHNINNDEKENIKKAIGIISFYEKLGIIEDDWYQHWSYYRDYQRSLHKKNLRNNKPESKDNKDYFNGGGGSNRNKIRYPKKCRKTAWKRFYKLFPKLKPDEKN